LSLHIIRSPCWRARRSSSSLQINSYMFSQYHISWGSGTKTLHNIVGWCWTFCIVAVLVVTYSTVKGINPLGGPKILQSSNIQYTKRHVLENYFRHRPRRAGKNWLTRQTKLILGDGPIQEGKLIRHTCPNCNESGDRSPKLCVYSALLRAMGFISSYLLYETGPVGPESEGKSRSWFRFWHLLGADFWLADIQAFYSKYTGLGLGLLFFDQSKTCNAQMWIPAPSK